MNPEGTPPSLLCGWFVSLVEDSFSIGEVAMALFFAPHKFGTKRTESDRDQIVLDILSTWLCQKPGSSQVELVVKAFYWWKGATT
jgi:hypothetical protein